MIETVFSGNVKLSFAMLTFGQFDNGMYWAEFKFNDGEISAMTDKSRAELKNYVHNIIRDYHDTANLKYVNI